MQNLHFSPQEREKLEKALKLFFERSSVKQATAKGLKPQEISFMIRGFLVDYGFFVDCSFGVGNKAKDTWIIFIRKDIPNIKASWGVYPRICFHTASNQIEVSIDISTSKHKITKKLYEFAAKPKVSNYNSQNSQNAYFSYPSYDIDSIITKLEQDLQWFLQLPTSELEYAHKI